MKKEIKTTNAPAAPRLLSQAIEKDGLVFTSGQIHLTTDGKLVEGSMEEKTHQVMQNLKAILAAAELGFEDVLKVTVYIVNMTEYSKFNAVYVTYFEAPFPAREVVCVKELPLSASVEISVIAKK